MFSKSKQTICRYAVFVVAGLLADRGWRCFAVCRALVRCRRCRRQPNSHQATRCVPATNSPTSIYIRRLVTRSCDKSRAFSKTWPVTISWLTARNLLHVMFSCKELVTNLCIQAPLLNTAIVLSICAHLIFLVQCFYSYKDAQNGCYHKKHLDYFIAC